MKEGICSNPDCIFNQRQQPKPLGDHGACYPCERAIEKAVRRLKPVAKESETRAKEQRQYAKENKEFAKEDNTCMAAHLTKETGIKCNGEASETHHKGGKIGKALLDFKTCIRLCTAHHRWVELHPKEAKALRLSISRLQKEEQ